MSKQCHECGAEVTRRGAHFCSPSCRKAFNNRRATRGAQLYDLFMESRINRQSAQGQNLWSVMCRLAADWRDEDKRAGRHTHGDPGRIIEENPWITRGLAAGGR